MTALLPLLQQHLTHSTGAEAAATEELIQLIQSKESCFERVAEEDAVHITAGVLLLNHDEDRILLMHHKKLGMWMQFGGHADGDSDLYNVAAKEVSEECGIEGITFLEPQPLEVARFSYPQEVFGYSKSMLDVRFLAKAPKGAIEQKNSESKELRWCTLDEAFDLAATNDDPGTTNILKKYQISQEKKHYLKSSA